MKNKASLAIFSIIISLSLALAPVSTASAISTGFSTSITYQNIGSDIAHVTILYYADGKTEATSIVQPDLAVGASQTVSLANLAPATIGTRGAVVIKSDMEIAVLTTQVPTPTTIKGRGLASATSSGSSQIWLPNLRKASNGTQVLSIQNLDSAVADIKLTFYGGASPVSVEKKNIPAGGSAYIDLAEVTGLTIPFIGTAQVVTAQSGSTTPGKISGMALHSFGTATEVYATESISTGGNKLYMPLALCYGMGGMSTSYYVFNTDATQSAIVTVLYSSGKLETATLPAHGQRYFNACTPTGTVSGYSGSAVITTNGPAILAVGNIKSNGMAATFTGQAVGGKKLALPVALYSTANYANGQKSRTTISVMNLGSSLAAGAVKARYYGRDGTLVGTVSFPAFASGSRIDTSAAQLGTAGAEFGYYSNGVNGGSVIIEGLSGSSLVAVAWVVNVAGPGLYSGETYNAIITAGQ